MRILSPRTPAANVRRRTPARPLFPPAIHLEPLESRQLLSIVINELVASNLSGITDQDGDRSDWIELKNTGPSAVNLGGWYLTDDAATLTKWQFPATTIPAGGYLLVFASDKNRAIAGQELHANFKLTPTGEFLALVQSNGTTIESSFNPFPATQKDDVSYGIAAGPATVATTLLPHGAIAKWYWPSAQDASIDDFWHDIAFNDAAWNTTTTGVGFDSDDNTLDPYFGAEQTMASTSGRTSAYIRIPFSLADKDQLTSLILGMRFDDGFIAYLNGSEIARANADTSLKPYWNQNARGTRLDTAWNGNVYDSFDITPWIAKLVNGTNVLAIHGMNATGTHLTDFLIDPLLTATRATGTMAGFMSGPTPGAANGAGTLGFVGDTHFSVDRGFFTAAFQTQITTNTPGASIRYTLDGSEPTSSYGTLYTGPISISTTTTLRAIAYKAGWIPSNADTETYLFLNDVIHQSAATVPGGLATWGHAGPDYDMDPDIVNNPAYAGTIVNDLKSIPTVSIVMDWKDLFGPSPQGMYAETTPWHASSDPRPTSVEYFTADGLTQWHLDAAVEIQGGSSDTRWRDDKLSLELKFKFPYGPTKLDFPVFAGSPDGAHAATRFDQLLLDAQYNYTWLPADLAQTSAARYVQDQVTSDLQNRAGGTAPHGQFVHVYLNGFYWGMYDLHEKAGDSFAAAYTGGNKDDYSVIKHSATTWADGGITALNDYAALLAAVRQNMTVLANYQAVESLLDVDDFIDYMIVSYYAGNWDWGSDNWYASHNRVDAGARWHFHSWDQEHSFQTDDNGDQYNVNYDSTTKNDSGGPTEIQQRLMASPEYKLKFADHVQKLLYNGGLLTPASVLAIYQARAAEVQQALVAESARWGDNRVSTPYTVANWITTTNGVYANFIPQRTGVLLSQFSNTVNHPGSWLLSLAAPVFSSYGGEISPGAQLTLTKPAGSPATAIIYYTTDGTDPRLVGNALGASAIAYAGPITFNASTRIRARIRDGSTWSALVDATYLVAGSYPLRITEINYHPSHNPALLDDEDQEFIELRNTGTQAISLQGVQITQFTTTPYVFGNLSLAAGQCIVVARNPAIFAQVYGSGINLAPTGYGTANLSNAGERIALLGPLGETLQDFTYDDVAPWPTAPDGAGPSLELVDPLADPAVPTSWQASARNGGTPGYARGTPALPGDGNADGTVDLADFNLWFSHVGMLSPAGIGVGDFNNDANVDLGDFNLWFSHVGATLPLAPTSPTLSAVSLVSPTALPPVDSSTPAHSKALPTHDKALRNKRKALVLISPKPKLCPPILILHAPASSSSCASLRPTLLPSTAPQDPLERLA